MNRHHTPQARPGVAVVLLALAVASVLRGDRVGSIAIAVHGTAAGGGRSGAIHAAEVRFAP